MARKDDLDVTFIALISVLSILITVVLFVASIALFNSYQNFEYQRKVVDQDAEEYNQLVKTQHDQILAYRWINEASGKVAIPIDIAMDQITNEFQN